MNVESATATPVEVAVKSIATPGPPAPPSKCIARNVTALEVADADEGARRGRHDRHAGRSRCAASP